MSEFEKACKWRKLKVSIDNSEQMRCRTSKRHEPIGIRLNGEKLKEIES